MKTKISLCRYKSHSRIYGTADKVEIIFFGWSEVSLSAAMERIYYQFPSEWETHLDTLDEDIKYISL